MLVLPHIEIIECSHSTHVKVVDGSIDDGLGVWADVFTKATPSAGVEHLAAD